MPLQLEEIALYDLASSKSLRNVSSVYRFYRCCEEAQGGRTTHKASTTCSNGLLELASNRINRSMRPHVLLTLSEARADVLICSVFVSVSVSLSARMICGTLFFFDLCAWYYSLIVKYG